MKMKKTLSRRLALGVSGIAAFAATSAVLAGSDTYIQVKVENLAPDNGTYLTPFWTGFHNGNFDLFDAGQAASASLERLAEDGNTSFVSSDFMNSGMGAAGGVIAPGGPFAPGSAATMLFSLDSNDAMSRYFSYASMVIPSNDAFVGNDNAMAHQIFDANGNFVGNEIMIMGSDVLDAGTEVNDELPMNTAFFGQGSPNTGDSEGGVIRQHEGFFGSFGNPNGQPSILADPMFANADFTLPGYAVARITFREVPAPGALALLGLPMLSRKRRRK